MTNDTGRVLPPDLPDYPNAVVYSEDSWCVARRSSAGDDFWFCDTSAERRGARTTAQLLERASDWKEMVPRG